MDISLAVAEEEAYIGSTKTRPKQLESGGRGQYCCVPMCKNARYDKHKNKTNIGLFTFPKNNPQLLKKWISVFNNIRRQGGVDNFNVEKKYTFVCEFHFNKSDIIFKPCSGRKTLRKDAIPSIFVFKENIIKKERKTLKKRLNCNTSTEALKSETCYSIENDIDFHIDCPKEVVVCENCQTLKEQLEQLKKENNFLKNENNFLKNENLKLTKVNSNINDEIKIKNKNEFNYENISTEPKLFKSLTGLEVDRFNDIFFLVDPGEHCEFFKFYDSHSSVEKKKKKQQQLKLRINAKRRSET